MNRWTLRILLCLILGAISTVAVAWALVALFWTDVADRQYDSRQHGRMCIGAEYLWITRYKLPTVIYVAGCSSEDGLRRPGEFAQDILGGNVHLSNVQLPRGDTVGLAFDWWENVGAGWPRMCLWMEYDDYSLDSEALQYRWALPLPIAKRHGLVIQRKPTLPLRPIWPGFAINTLFYAAIWFALLFGFTSAKRAIRRKRGRCPRCGYDLRSALENGCSECGWNRAP